eukprot:m.207132 g.207132  ORF g.207132 m.207132 type:complete len:793 (-) comp15801_c0_seq17:38-2416(-)
MVIKVGLVRVGLSTRRSDASKLIAAANKATERLYVLLDGDWKDHSTKDVLHRMKGIYSDIYTHNDDLDTRILLPSPSGMQIRGAPELEALLGYRADPQDIAALDAINTARSNTRLSSLTFNELEREEKELVARNSSQFVPLNNHSPHDLVQFEAGCNGGTFDRLHIGHKLFLSVSALSCTTRLFCGVTAPSMLKKKKIADAIEPIGLRCVRALQFLESVRPGITYEVAPIHDPFGPSITDPDLTGIIVSEETLQGGEAVNRRRKEAELGSLKINVVDLVNGDTHDTVVSETKASSSGKRVKELGVFRSSLEEWYRQTLDDLPYCVGLTGGIASGKTSACRYLESLGAYTVNCDKLGWDCYAPGGPAYTKLIEVFGEDILSSNGEVNRKALGAIIFQDPSQRHVLEGIVWPEIAKLAIDEMKQAKKLGHDVCILEAAVLLEAGWETMCEEVWSVLCSTELCCQRVMERNQLSEEEAKKRIAAQMSNGERLAKSNVLIYSEWAREQTDKQLKKAWDFLQPRVSSRLETAPAGSLAHYWCEALGHLLQSDNGCYSEASKRWFRKIRDSASSRSFHNLAYLHTTLTIVNEHRSLLSRWELVTMSVLFSRFQMNTEIPMNKNQADCAAAFQHFAADLGISKEDSTIVKHYIEQSANRTKGDTTSNDLLYFLDMDAAILGSPGPAYARYREQVRQQSGHMSTLDNRDSRIQFLEQHMLSDNRVYFTSEFQQKLGQQALALCRFKPNYQICGRMTKQSLRRVFCNFITSFIDNQLFINNSKQPLCCTSSFNFTIKTRTI